MSDLTAEQIYEACAGFNFMSDKMDGHRYVVIERAALPYADALAEGRVLPPLVGERRIVLTTVDGEWSDSVFQVCLQAMTPPEGRVWGAIEKIYSVLDALAGEGT